MKKKKAIRDWVVFPASRKKNKILGITKLFMLAVTILVSASVYSQSSKLTLKYNNITYKKLFQEIEKITEYRFAYSESKLDPGKEININVTDETLEQVLNNTLPTGITYDLINNYVIILNESEKSRLTEKREEQQRSLTVSGKVSDTYAMPLPGVTVTIKGTTSGTVTDIDGNYMLSGIPVGATLVYSFVGMTTQEIPVNNRERIDVLLDEGSIGLEEVVAIGYGTMKKSDLTGAVSSVRTEDLTITSDASIGQLLKGKAAGVTAISTSAQPGGGVSILIRGAASTGASNEPLYVIDGFPISNESLEPGNGTQYSQGNRSHLNSLNPSDIESIEILKDASATAIYGSRAANGVILITTKRGSDGLNLNYSGSFTGQYIDKPFEVYDAKNYMIQTNKLLKERWLRDRRIFPYGNTDPSSVTPFTGERFTQEQILSAGKGTNWWDEIMQPGHVQNHNVSITFGNEKMRSYVSLGIYNNDGVVKGSAIDRISSKINLDYTITDYLKAGLSYMGAIINNNNVQMGEGEWGDSNMIMSALLYDPTVPVKDEEGRYSEMSWYANLPNPVSYQDVTDKTKQTRNLSTFYLQLEPVENMLIKTSIGYDGQSSTRETYFPKSFLLGKNKDGLATIGYANREDLLFNTVATYNIDLMKKHKFTVMAGYEYQQFNSNGHSLGGSGFFTDALLFNNIGVSDHEKYSIGSYKNREVLASYFGRINYNLIDKYLLTLNLRYDGSDKFGKNNKWGFFPSASVGWRVSEEDFLSGYEQLSNLKLRVSYGQTGNSNIGSNAFAFFDPNANRYAFNSAPVTGVELSQIANDNLKWETTTELNIGLDVGFFNNRISGVIELFDKTISDLLGGRDLRSWMVVPTVSANLGKTQSRGVEITLNTVNIDRKEFQWHTDFTYTLYRDRWKERSPDVVLNPWQKVNDPIRALHYWRTDGIIQPGETVEHMPNAVPGNVKVVDVDGFDADMNYLGEPDGIINEADIVYLGTTDPNFSIGLNNTFKYREFDLNIYAYGIFDQLSFNGVKNKYIGYSSHMVEDGTNLWVEASKRWSSENPNGIYPSDATNSYMGADAWTIEDASFIRVKNLTLGYNFPSSKLIDEISKLRIFIDAQNPFLFTKWTGMDPEIAGANKAPYPNQRSYSFGVNLEF
ncbi:MAG: TonB-dependent receptor [Fermentimonas sp.]|nr:TonB-dependent receptor [Fermentimonas sp.]